ncbi:hypothetical protein EBR25_08985 [bacterium]|nr:hypothetical protein [bacterium]
MQFDSPRRYFKFIAVLLTKTSLLGVFLSASTILPPNTASSQTNESTVLHEFFGDATQQYLGVSVSFVGDVDGDGYDDMIIGAHYADTDNGPDTGKADVISGSDGSILFTFMGDSTNSQFGFAVAGPGDLNGDGTPDFLVSAPEVSAGIVKVFSGSDGSLLATLAGDNFSDKFGYSLAAAGDVNGDGTPDWIAGAIGDDDNGSLSGSARVFSGIDNSTLYTFYGDSTLDQFGYSVDGAGDVNSDGFADVIVGAYGDDDNGSQSGSARVLSGSDGSTLHTFLGDATNDYLGTSVAGVGDINGDGHADIAAGAYGDDNGYTDSGSVQVYSGIDGTVLFTFNGEDSYKNFGKVVTSAGDINEDGIPDIMVGGEFHFTAIKRVRVLSGADGATLYAFTADLISEFGNTLAGEGDVNADGLPDFMVGAWRDGTTDTDAGRAIVYADECPSDNDKGLAGQCGCGIADTDTDSDGTADCIDACAADPLKIISGVCGCGTPDSDSDGDGTPDCNDLCSADPEKTAPGTCGCGVADTDADGDGTPDCNDLCSADPLKTEAGFCGCGAVDEDANSNGIIDCFENPSDPDVSVDSPNTSQELLSLVDISKLLAEKLVKIERRYRNGKKRKLPLRRKLAGGLDTIHLAVKDARNDTLSLSVDCNTVLSRVETKTDRLKRRNGKVSFRFLKRYRRSVAKARTICGST